MMKCNIHSLMCIAEETEPKGASKKRSGKPESTFRGVRKRSWGRYVSEIRLPGQKTRIWLGSFSSAEMAARAYDSAAFFLKGTSATLNFPELVESLPRPRSSSRRDIQSAAAKAAHNPPSPKIETQWWEHFGDDDDDCVMSFEDVKEAPLMSPLRLHLDPTFSDFSWNQFFDFKDDILNP